MRLLCDAVRRATSEPTLAAARAVSLLPSAWPLALGAACAAAVVAAMRAAVHCWFRCGRVLYPFDQYQRAVVWQRIKNPSQSEAVGSTSDPSPFAALAASAPAPAPAPATGSGFPALMAPLGGDAGKAAPLFSSAAPPPTMTFGASGSSVDLLAGAPQMTPAASSSSFLGASHRLRKARGESDAHAVLRGSGREPMSDGSMRALRWLLLFRRHPISPLSSRTRRKGEWRRKRVGNARSLIGSRLAAAWRYVPMYVLGGSAYGRKLSSAQIQSGHLAHLCP